MVISRLKKLILFVVIVTLAVGVVPSPQPKVQAQAGVVDQVLVTVARNLGMAPAPTRGQLDMGTVSFSVDMGYDFTGLDLRTVALSCTAPRLGKEEQIIGNVGYEVVVTVQNRRYEFRTNSTGSRLIRCQNGQEVTGNFGVMPSVGTTLTGDQIAEQAINHLNGYLQPETPLTRQGIIDRTLPYRASYTWNATVFTSASMGCPASGATYTQGDMFGYRVTVTVQGRSYRYFARGDGGVLLLCLGGRPDASSVGL